MELIIIKLFYNYNLYIKYYNLVDTDFIKHNSKQLERLLITIEEYHKKFPEKGISSTDELEVFYFSLFPVTSVKERETMEPLFKKLTSTTVTDEVAEEYLISHAQRSKASKIALLSLQVSEGTRDYSELTSELEKLNGSMSVGEQWEFVQDNQEEGRPEQGIRWPWDTLNRMMGSLRKGNFGFVFARPETGKTTFLADFVRCAVKQVKQPILWFNNEQPGIEVLHRVMQAYFGIDGNEFYKHKKDYSNKYYQETQNLIKIVDDALINKRKVEAICQAYNPSLIIFDQIDKIKGFADDRNDLELKAIYQWARELAKRYGPTIGICQASASGEGKKWLNMDDVDGSKCLAPETPVLMYDGTWKEVQHINVGERVMGPDSCPRNVISTGFGCEEMFRITHKIGGDSYDVNKSHILSVYDNHLDEVVDIPLDKWFKNQNRYYGIRSSYQLAEKILPIDPYWFGLWLGDGKKDEPEITTLEPEIKQYIKEYANRIGCSYVEHKNGENLNLVQSKIKYKQGVKHPILESLKSLGVYSNKSIPNIYLRSAIWQRLELLAGIIDTDGTLAKRNHEYYSVTNKNLNIASGTKQLALSCGFMASMKFRNGYYYVTISGNLSNIPCKVKRKKSIYQPKRNVTFSKLEIESLGIGKYCGITIDKDHRYIIDNCIVTHNTAKQGEADWILGIGKSNQEGMESIRHFHLCKNKLLGDEDTDASQRHGKADIIINAAIARYEDIKK